MSMRTVRRRPRGVPVRSRDVRGVRETLAAESLGDIIRTALAEERNVQQALDEGRLAASLLLVCVQRLGGSLRVTQEDLTVILAQGEHLAMRRRNGVVHLLVAPVKATQEELLAMEKRAFGEEGDG